MNGQFQVAQASGTGNSGNSTPPRIFKLSKPLTDQAVVVNLGYDQKVQVDFSSIANEKITLVHVGEKLIILFDNQSTVTVEPFFDSRHDALNNLTIEVAPGRDLSVAEFASSFPITTDQSVLPAAGDGGNAQATGGHFDPSAVDALPPVPTNVLAPPEILPNLQFINPTGVLLTTPTAPATPDATIVKSFTTTPHDAADANQVDHAGQAIHYTVVVTNTGNETLTGVTVTDSQGIALTGGSTTLAAGASETLTGTHIVTQAEVDAGTGIVNTASLTDSQGVTGTSTVTTVVDQDPSVSIVKTFVTTPHDAADAGQADHAGQAINYSVVVTNNGNETLTGVTVTDSQGNILTGGSTTLAVGASETLTGSLTVTQAQIDAGTAISNTATVTDNQGVTGTSTVTTAIDQDPSVSIVKSFTTTPNDAADANQVDHANQVINYSVVVTNTGNETLTNVQVTDAIPGVTLSGGQTTLAVGASETLTGSLTVTQAQIDAGNPISNTATVTDTQQGITATTSNQVTTAIDQDPSVSIVKSFTTTPSDAADANQVDHANQVINYSVVVTNTGNETLTNVQVTDAIPGVTLSGGQTTLAVGASETLTGSLTVTQAQIDAGTAISNTATVTDTQQGITATTSNQVTTAIDQDPSVSIVKSFTTTPSDAADANQVDHANQVINYSVVVTNTGNETLTNVQVTDAIPGVTLSGGQTTLAVGASETLTGSLTVTQAQIDAGTAISNTATVTDTQQGITATTSNQVTTAIDQDPSVSIVKSFTTTPNDAADANQVDHANQVINYSVVVTNTGNETLTNVQVTDAIPGVTLSGGQTTLAVGASETLTGSLTVTQAQIDAGNPISNTATVTDTQQGITVTTSNQVTTAIDQDPSVSIVKSFTTTPNDAADANQVDHANQVINYSVVVTNTGNETLTNVQVADAIPGVTLSGGQTTLAVGASETLTGSLTVTQAQIDAGNPISNTATVTDTQQGITATTSNQVTTAIDQDPSVSIVKSFTTTPSDAADANQVDHANQVINYSVVVTNTGNETLTNVQVTDAIPGVTLSGGQTTLAVGASETLTGSLTVTQAQIDAGTAISNTATVTDTQQGTTVTTSNQVTTAIDQDPSVSIVKSFTTTPSDAADANQVDHANQVINYSVVVTNTGNETLTNVQVTDAIPGVTLSGGQTTLAVGASETLTGSLTVTQAQIDAGNPISNTATVTDAQQGITVTTSNQVTTAIDQDPSVSIVKSFTTTPNDAADANQVDHANQVINYSVVVTNTGNETLTNVQVTDAIPGVTLSGGQTTLAVGASETLTGSLTVTQAQIDAGNPISNTATVTDTQQGITATTSNQVTTAIDQDPSVSIVKSFTTTPSDAADANQVDHANQVIHYSVVVTNTGNETLTNVQVTDAIPGVTLSGGSTTLAVGASETLTGSLTVTQAQIDAGTAISNTATVTDTQQGTTVTTSNQVTTAIDQDPPTESGAVSLKVFEAGLTTVPNVNDIQAGITTGTNPGGVTTPETAQSGAGNQLTFTAATDNITGIVFGAVGGIVVGGSTLPSADFFWDINGSGQLEGHIGSANGPLGIILAITGDTTATADGGTATPTITATLTDAFPMPTGPAGTVSISVTGIQVIAETSGIHDTSNPGAVSVTIVDDTPSIGAIQDVVMPNVINTDAHGTWQPNFDADGPNLTAAIGIAMGPAPTGETFTMTDTHTTNGGHEIFQVAVTGPTNYTFYEYTTYTSGTQTAEMFAYTSEASAQAGLGNNEFFTLSMAANGTYDFHLVTDSLQTAETFDLTAHSGNGEIFEINGNTGAYHSPHNIPTTGFDLLIDGWDSGDTDPTDHTIHGNTNGFGVDNGNLDTNETIAFTAGQDQSSMTIGVGKGGNATSETLQITIWNDAHTVSATEIVTQADGTAIKIDAADWLGTGANNAFFNFKEADVTNLGGTSGRSDSDDMVDLTGITFNESTTVGSTTLNFTPTITDGDGDTATGGNLSVALNGANSSGGYTLTGTGGDVFVASAHADTFTGTGTGNTVDYSNAPSAVTINLGTDTVSGGTGWTSGDTLHDIQNAIGSDAGGNVLTGLAAGGSLLIGEGSGNVLTGQGSGNILVGGTGSDTLNGSNGGHDIFALQGTGGSLNDTITNFSSTDEIVLDVGSRDITFGNAQTIGTAAAISASQFSTGSGAPTSVGAAGSFYFDSAVGHNNLYYSNGTTEIELAHIATGVAVTASQIHVH